MVPRPQQERLFDYTFAELMTFYEIVTNNYYFHQVRRQSDLLYTNKKPTSLTDEASHE